MSWDVTSPAGSDPISQGDDVIRTFKTDLQTALRASTTDGAIGKFPGADAANPVYHYRGRKDTTVNRPAATDEGLFFDTTRQVLQRSNGSSYDDVGTVIPSGTKVPFYQAAAPTGWTAVAVNDKFLRVVSAGGSGGTTGGTHAASTSLAHSHTVNSHSHTIGQVPLDYDIAASNLDVSGTQIASPDNDGDLMATGSAGTGNNRKIRNRLKSGQSTGAATPGTDTQFTGSFAYADVVIASKD